MKWFNWPGHMEKARIADGFGFIDKFCDLNLKQPQQEERQRDLFFAKTVSIFEPLKLMLVNLRCLF